MFHITDLYFWSNLWGTIRCKTLINSNILTNIWYIEFNSYTRRTILDNRNILRLKQIDCFDKKFIRKTHLLGSNLDRILYNQNCCCIANMTMNRERIHYYIKNILHCILINTFLLKFNWILICIRCIFLKNFHIINNCRGKVGIHHFLI